MFECGCGGMVDTGDLKSPAANTAWGFESPQPQKIKVSIKKRIKRLKEQNTKRKKGKKRRKQKKSRKNLNEEGVKIKYKNK